MQLDLPINVVYPFCTFITNSFYLKSILLGAEGLISEEQAILYHAQQNSDAFVLAG